VHFEWEGAAAAYLPLVDVWRCPVVVSCHGRGVNVLPHGVGRERWLSRLETVFDRATAVHCVSEAIAREACQYGLEPAKTWLIRPAVDTDLFTPVARRRPDRSRLRILAVGDLDWVKGYEYALQAIRLVADEGIPVHLDILGGDPAFIAHRPSDRSRIHYTIEDLGLRGSVEVHGEVPSAEVASRLRDADVLLHASLSEGIPTAVLEAMACAVPVVAADCGGVREAGDSGSEGLLFAPRDARAAAAALTTIWADPELGLRMGQAGRSRVEAEFDADQQTRSFVRLYEHVTDGHDGR
jgi:colanic acid/amylovoran biosynthesis glycosyltransferase